MAESCSNATASTKEDGAAWVKTTVKIVNPSSSEDNASENSLRSSEPVRRKEPYIETIALGEQFSKEKNKIAMTPQSLPNREMSVSTLVKAALKTPLGDVLRRNMAAEKLKKQTEKLGSNKPSLGMSPSDDNKVSSDESKVPSDAKKNLNIKPELRAGARKTFTPLSYRRELVCKSSEATPPNEDGMSNEAMDQKSDVPVLKIAEPGNVSTPSSSKIKKTRRRHFKGGTYGLYLCPSRKKQKLAKKMNDTNSKDDEMSLASTENGSCIDSDGSSMFSDFTPSEKSLADDEACSSSRCSPILLPSDNQQEANPKEVIPTSENQNFSCHESPQTPPSDKTVSDLSTSVPDVDNSTSPLSTKSTENVSVEKSPETNNCPLNNLENNHSPTKTEPLIVEHIKQEIVEDDHNKIQEEAVENTPEIGDEALENTYQKRGDSARKSLKPYPHQNKMVARASDVKNKLCLELKENLPSNDNEFQDINMNSETEETPAKDGASTIATSVKSRQRMRRRFTDDVVDTDLGLLSLNSLSSCRKIKQESPPTQTIYIKDIATNFADYKDKLSSTPKQKPINRAEYICHPKKAPTAECCCAKDPIRLSTNRDENDVFCQAVDCIDDKRLGCCHPIIRKALIRPSFRMPYTVMCDMHLWRLRSHHACPRCGMFCSQGTFMRCTGPNNSERVNHLFHEACALNMGQGAPDCPHCGISANVTAVKLNLSLTSSPANLAYANYFKSNPVAKMGFSTSPKIDKNAIVKLKSGSILSTAGPLSLIYQKSLETMLISLNLKKMEDIPSYSSRELYQTVIEGDVFKLLFMLQQGVSPNTKFPDYNSGTALHAAAKAGNVVETHILIQAGGLIDALNDCLQTPVMLATESDKLEVVKYLVYRMADVDIRGESGSTCLHFASKDGNTNMCKVLLSSCKIKLNLQDDGGWTALVWASEHGHYEIVELLLERGADPNIRDKEGNTALHWAAFSGNADICNICCSYGCNVNEINLHGDSPLHIAARRDNSAVVEYLLARMASCDIKNGADQLPLDCCLDDTASNKAIKLNSMMASLFKTPERGERIVTSDISFGKERVPIQCVNWFDDEDLINKDFLYVIENCETGPVNIDRSITSLQCCDCENDCASSTCTCSNISFKCWYDKDGRLVPEFNMFDPPMLFECNRACICDAASCRNRIVQRGLTCRLQLFRTANKGWGVRTLKDISKGTFICEYVGEIISDSEADKREDDSYLFDLDNRDGETFCLDARHFGNISRFINHQCEPNLVPVKVFIDHQDLSFPRIAFFSARDIAQYEELGFDYGEKFWIIKYKWFTCTCGSPSCKYSSETIKETLANYSERNAEEHVEHTNN